MLKSGYSGAHEAALGFNLAVTGKAIVKSDPAVGVTLGAAGPFEVFVECVLIQGA